MKNQEPIHLHVYKDQLFRTILVSWYLSNDDEFITRSLVRFPEISFLKDKTQKKQCSTA